MSTVVVYGASDDLVEVEGKPFTDEFDCYDRKGNRVTFDCGTVLDVTYSPDGSGLWKVKAIKTGPETTVCIVEATDADSDNYSDRATVTGPFTKVRFRKGREAK